VNNLKTFKNNLESVSNGRQYIIYKLPVTTQTNVNNCAAAFSVTEINFHNKILSYK